MGCESLSWSGENTNLYKLVLLYVCFKEAPCLICCFYNILQVLLALERIEQDDEFSYEVVKF